MEKRLFWLMPFLVLLLLLWGCQPQKDPQKEKELEKLLEQGLNGDASDELLVFDDPDLNPKYQPKIYRDEKSGEMMIDLTIDGVKFAFPYDEQYKQALLEIRDRIPEKSTIMAWWPHAGMIMAYTNSYVAAFAPSPRSFEIGEVTREDWPYSYLAADEDLHSIARAFLSTDSLVAYSILDDYTAEYILVFNDDERYLNDFYGHLGRSIDEHFDDSGALSEEARLSVFNRMLKHGQIGNFGRISVDDKVSLYKKVVRFGA